MHVNSSTQGGELFIIYRVCEKHSDFKTDTNNLLKKTSAHVKMADEFESNEVAMSHKGKKISSYSLKFKLEAIAYAENNSINSSSKKFNVERKRIREWKSQKEELLSLKRKDHGAKRKRLDGAGRKPLDQQMEEVLVEWIYDRREKGLRVSRKLIMKKALFIYNEKSKESDSEDSATFVASTGWLQKFMRRNGLSLRRKTSVAQKDPSKLIDKLVAYIINARRFAAKHNYSPGNIIAMDETPVWADMVSDTTVDKTGARTITMKTTGHEKCRVSVCLTAKADGSKLKPFIVFKNAKRDTKALNEEFKTKCVIVNSSNGWMNDDLTLEYTKTVLGTFSFGRRFLAWDSYECHMDSKVAASLKSSKIDQVIIPGGCTKFIQAPDVVWNKPFKAMCAEKYDQWLEEEGIHNETAEGNLKAPPRKRIVQWNMELWGSLSVVNIKQSLKSYALYLNVDGSEDDNIHCFKNHSHVLPTETGCPHLFCNKIPGLFQDISRTNFQKSRKF